MKAEKPLALSVKIVIRDEDGRILLLKRSMKSKGNPGKWDLPGGKVDAGENFDDTLRREIREETGLEVSVDGLVGTAQSESPTSRIIYLILAGCAKSCIPRLSDEHEGFLWVTAEELSEVDLAPQFRNFADQYSRNHSR